MPTTTESDVTAVNLRKLADALRSIREEAIPVLLMTSDMAHLLGVTSQRIHTMRLEGKLPSPDFQADSCGPLWLPERSVEAASRRGGQTFPQKTPQPLMAVADIASVLKVQRQTIQGRQRRGGLPQPDYKARAAGSLWKPETLIERGIIPEAAE
jgi:hypothetical protein